MFATLTIWSACAQPFDLATPPAADIFVPLGCPRPVGPFNITTSDCQISEHTCILTCGKCLHGLGYPQPCEGACHLQGGCKMIVNEGGSLNCGDVGYNKGTCEYSKKNDDDEYAEKGALTIKDDDPKNVDEDDTQKCGMLSYTHPHCDEDYFCNYGLGDHGTCQSCGSRVCDHFELTPKGKSTCVDTCEVTVKPKEKQYKHKKYHHQPKYRSVHHSEQTVHRAPVYTHTVVYHAPYDPCPGRRLDSGFDMLAVYTQRRLDSRCPTHDGWVYALVWIVILVIALTLVCYCLRRNKYSGHDCLGTVLGSKHSSNSNGNWVIDEHLREFDVPITEF